MILKFKSVTYAPSLDAQVFSSVSLKKTAKLFPCWQQSWDTDSNHETLTAVTRHWQKSRDTDSSHETLAAVMRHWQPSWDTDSLISCLSRHNAASSNRSHQYTRYEVGNTADVSRRVIDRQLRRRNYNSAQRAWWDYCCTEREKC